MTFFRVNYNDLSPYVSELNISYKENFNSQTNAAGDTMVDWKSTKRIVEVKLIPMKMFYYSMFSDVIGFENEIEYLDPKTQQLNVINAILPSNAVSFYTIQDRNQLLNAVTLTFEEL